MNEDDDDGNDGEGPERLALQVLAGTEDGAGLSPEPDIGVEIRRLESEMHKLQEKLRLTTLTLYAVERERDQAMAKLAEVEADHDHRPPPAPVADRTTGPGQDDAPAPKMKLSAQLESLAMALHAASAEAEANDMELQLERQRRLAARTIADDLIRRLTSAADAAPKEDSEGDRIVTRSRASSKGAVDSGRLPIRTRKEERKTPSRANADTVDRAIDHLRQRFQQMNVTIPIAREDDFIYRLGRDRLYIQIIQGKLMLRQSGRYIDLLQWLESRY